jgi:hypothetical protein
MISTIKIAAAGRNGSGGEAASSSSFSLHGA